MIKNYFEKWDGSNHYDHKERHIPESFRGAIYDESTSAKDFLAKIEKCFVKSDKVEIASTSWKCLVLFQGFKTLKIEISKGYSSLYSLKLSSSYL